MSPRVLKLVNDDRGAALIELAMVAPVLLTLMVGVIDMSNVYSRKLAIEQGAHRAIEKIMQTTEDSTVEATLSNEVICQVNGTNANGSCKTTPYVAHFHRYALTHAVAAARAEEIYALEIARTALRAGARARRHHARAAMTAEGHGRID